MKQWPEDGSSVHFEDLVDPVCKAIKFAYDIKRKNIDKSIPWSGLGISELQKSYCLDAKKLFKAEMLAYAEKDQGRDALKTIIGHAMRIGIEQGMRIAKTDSEYKTLQTMAEVGKILLSKAVEENKEKL